MKSVLLIALVAVAMIGVMVPSVFGQYTGNVGSEGQSTATSVQPEPPTSDELYEQIIKNAFAPTEDFFNATYQPPSLETFQELQSLSPKALTLLEGAKNGNPNIILPTSPRDDFCKIIESSYLTSNDKYIIIEICQVYVDWFENHFELIFETFDQGIIDSEIMINEMNISDEKKLEYVNKIKSDTESGINIFKSTQLEQLQQSKIFLESYSTIDDVMTVASFVDLEMNPQHYLDRYNNEPSYKEWFNENYPQYYSIYQAVYPKSTKLQPSIDEFVGDSDLPIKKIKFYNRGIDNDFRIDEKNNRLFFTSTSDYSQWNLVSVNVEHDEHSNFREIGFDMRFNYDLNSNTNKIYLTQSERQSIFIIDSISLEILDEISVNHESHNSIVDIAVNENTNKIYVLLNDSTIIEKGKVSEKNIYKIQIFDGNTKNMIAEIILSAPVFGLLVDQTNNLLYAQNYHGNKYSILDDNEKVSVIKIPATSDQQFYGFLLNEKNNQMHIPLQGEGGFPSEYLVVEASSGKEIQRIENSFNMGYAIANPILSPKDNSIYFIGDSDGDGSLMFNMNIEKNRIYQDVISMFQVAFAKKDDGPLELAKDTFEKLPGTVIQPGHDIIQGNNMNWNDPSHPDYMPLPVEYDEQEEPEQPGIKERLSEIKDKLPFVGTKEKSFEEYTEDYLNTELEQFDSSVDKVAHLKEIWDERIKEANKDPNGVASREIEVIRKVWQELLI